MTDVSDSSWTGSDTVVVNEMLPLEVLLPPPELVHIHFIVTEDYFGLNKAVFFVRVDELAVDFLASILSYRTYNADRILTLADQSAMVEVLGMEKFKVATQVIPQHWLAGYLPGVLEGETTQPGDIMMHLPADRRGSMLGVIANLKHTSKIGNNTTGSKRLLNEARTFWKQQTVLPA